MTGSPLGAAVVFALGLAQAALAADQDVRPAAATETELEEVVVTGTLLRGIAPTGTNVIAVSRDDVIANGAASSNDLLASIPQVGNFGTVPRGNQDAGSPLVRPNIRNLGASGGSTTLVLLNGHRLVGAGVLSTSVDPSIIPPGVIERVDVIPDGGSSIYGSDAIGGVINFVTRARFDGIEATGRYGLADEYQTADTDLTFGHQWDGGSLVLAYAYAWHDNLLGADRDYASADHRSEGGPDLRNTACSPGNVTVGGTTYALPDRVAGTINRCDDPQAVDIYPEERRHSVYGSFMHALSSSIEFVTTGYWSRRDTRIRTAQSSQTGTITAANPYFQRIGAENAHNVAFSYADVFGPSNISNHEFESYGITPGLNFSIGERWQIRTQANLGRSNNIVHEDLANAGAAAAALAGTTIATALNPYNLRQTNPAVLAAIENYENLATASQELAEARALADGALFSLPGGEVRVALGGEYHYENLNQHLTSGPRGTRSGPGLTYSSRSDSSREVLSAFAEVFVPIFGDDNALPGLRALVLSGSIRHDDYSDVGGTTNPKIGINYTPVDDLVIRGNFGTSFHAPSLADSASTVASQVQILQVSPFRPVGSPITDLFRPTIIVAGGNPSLRPETADTWSAGFDWTPQWLDGLALSATYFNIDFTDAIGLVSSATLFTDPNFAPFFIINPTLEQALAATGSRSIVGAPSIESLYIGRSPFLLVDARINNFGSIKTDGLDFGLSYAFDAGPALLKASVSGTYTLDRRLSTGRSGPYTDTLKNGTGRVAYVAMLGARLQQVTANVSYNYRGGYGLRGLVSQTDIDAFDTIDLFFGYDLPRQSGLLAGTQLTLNIENVLDEDPPRINNNVGYTNGSTLGRLISLGVRKKL